ncbi:hypothetical protein [Adhaeribacter aquaticus]|uniref:hypothetical protein n=1 Tax=Adhaeribacter aquaticus TaxID=299567 RepID=UPI00047D23DA|nr:hypothetical protein [Adhaeribacter aquaticus]
MKHLLLILFTIFCFGCEKETKIDGIQFPKTELANTTWKRFSFKAVVSREDVYEFLHFTNANTVEMYSADIDGKNIINGKRVYPYKLTLSKRNIDSFEVFYPNGKSEMGGTTQDVNVIVFGIGDYKYDRVP